MLDAKDIQFRLAEDGVISFQAQESNPLPGVPIAKITKGERALKPVIKITDDKGTNATLLLGRLNDWLNAHLKMVLEPLIELEEENAFKVPVNAIIGAVHGALGILPRAELEDVIAQLDTDDRRDLRSKKIRLGPILVFIPALNKPAAVRLRALLWSVYEGAELPAGVPNDGIVSAKVDEAAVNKAFYQAIGYPVFGGRAIRIDMLDRVICAVYDGAEKGKFQAKHEMAEWLGCGIEDLYAVLSAMGHKKIEAEAAPEVIEKPAEEAVAEVVVEDESAAPAESEGGAVQKAVDVKPELAMFFLKKGKAFEKAGAGGKKPYKKSSEGSGGDVKKFEKKKGKRNKTNNREPKIMSAEAKVNPDDNPFAILGQLKK